MIHLTSADLAAEIELLLDPSLVPDDRNARNAAHLRECAVCRDRLSTLHAQDMEIARLMHEGAETPPDEASAAEVHALVEATMKRLREDIATERMANQQHLSAEALIALLEVDEGIASARDEHAPLREHLTRCEVCAQRLAALREQEDALVRAIMATEDESSPPTADDAHDQATVNRLVNETQRRLQQDARAGARGRIFRRFRAGQSLLGFAAGVGFMLVVPTLRNTATIPHQGAVALAPSGQSALQDTVSGFKGKQYMQKVNAGSEVNLVVQGINGSDFDCELYDATGKDLVAEDIGVQNSCRFSIVAPEAKEYRLVVTNQVGRPSSYMMVAQVVSERPRGAGRPAQPPAIVTEPIPTTP